jgi:hypothetical protein
MAEAEAATCDENDGAGQYIDVMRRIAPDVVNSVEEVQRVGECAAYRGKCQDQLLMLLAVHHKKVALMELCAFASMASMDSWDYYCAENKSSYQAQVEMCANDSTTEMIDLLRHTKRGNDVVVAHFGMPVFEDCSAYHANTASARPLVVQDLQFEQSPPRQWACPVK